MVRLREMTLRALLEQAVQLHRHRPALSTLHGTAFTFGELDERAAQIARLLHDRGIIAGDRVAILSENQPHWAIAYFAVTTLGAVAVPILPDFHQNEIHHIIRHSESRAIFVSSRMAGQLEETEFSSVSTTILLDDFSLVPRRGKKHRFEEMMEEGSREFAKFKEAALKFAGRIPPSVREEDLAAIVYTSGTTGHSKGVMLTHRNIVSDAIATLQIISLSHNDRLLSILPLSHTYECTLGLVTPIMIGASVTYLDKPPSASVLLPAMAEVRPTIILSVPLVIEKIYKGRIQPALHGRILVRTLARIPILRKALHRTAGRRLLESFGGALRSFCIGGAPLAPDVELFLREAKFPYAVGYGLTETSPMIAGASPERTRFRSVGPPLPGTSIRIDQPDPATGEGEIVVRGPTVMKGYYKDPGRTAEVMTPDGWFKTGDLGLIDAKGYLHIKGRLKNMILGPSGKNIYPEEIESVINEFEVVTESLVFQQNNQLVARVHLNYEALEHAFSPKHLAESQIRERIKGVIEDLRRQVNERVASFSRIQRMIEQSEPFEKTPTLKIKRHLYA